MSASQQDDRRRGSRLKVSVPVEICPEGSDAPMRHATSDLSLTGCYIESSFPLPVGTRLELKLQIDGGTLLILATVATCDTQFGNGISFSKMLPEDIEELRAFLEKMQKQPEKK